MSSELDAHPIETLLGQRLVICLGNGGVGKTTTAAALAMAAARRRRSTAVITVDPARRLKDSLGLSELSTDPRPVDAGEGSAELDALALDTKRVFDALIERVAPSPDIAQRILANRLYQEMSNGLGGSAEYMAMEKLYELLHRATYDVVVVDTPPSAHARDLLSAPSRMSALLASSAIRILKTPASLLWGDESRLGRVTLTALLKALERWTGLSVLEDISDFAAGFESLADGFRYRAREIDQALHREDTSFVLVSSPEPDTVESTIDFHRELVDGGFPIAGIIANRVHDFPELAADAGLGYPAALRHRLLANYQDFRALSERDHGALARLQEATGCPFLATLPVLEHPPACLADLRRLALLLDA